MKKFNLEDVAGLETKHTDNKTWGWTWRVYYVVNQTGPSPFFEKAKQPGLTGKQTNFLKIGDGAISGYFGYFDDVKRTSAVVGGGYNKEDWAIMCAIYGLLKSVLGLTDDEKEELKKVAETFQSGEASAIYENNQKAENGESSFWIEKLRKDDNRRGTYLGKYIYIYKILK